MRRSAISFFSLIVLFIHTASAQFSEQHAGTFTGLNRGWVKWGDFDNDGLLDLLISGRDGGNQAFTQLYRNTGSGFDAPASGLPVMKDGTFDAGDYDNDGDLDVVISGVDNNSTLYSRIYQNDGTGYFSEAFSGQLINLAYGTISWVDYDNDGRLDVFLTGTTGPAEPRSYLYRNTGASFTEVHAGSFIYVYESSAAWGDYDNDGDQDLVMGGRDNGGTTFFRLYQNTGSGFTSVSNPFPTIDLGSLAWGDYDNDGDLDLLITGISSGANSHTKVFKNTGGTFTEEYGSSTFSQIYNGCGVWGDYDNDGDLDILVSAWSVLDGTRIYRNTGSGFTYESGIAPNDLNASTAAWGDYDNDGDLDFVISGNSSGATYVTNLYRNDGSTFNTVPSAPTGLSASLNDNGSTTFTWNKSTDTQTAQDGLHYNLVVGTSAGNISKWSPMANRSTGWRRVVQLGNSPSNSISMTGLSADATYYWSVQAIDAAFAGSAFATEGTFTPASQPTVQASAVQFSSVDYQSMTISWTNGNGANRIVVMKQGSSVDADPSDGQNYSANSAFGSGEQIGTGNYVVYNGSGNSVTVTGLTLSTAYYIAVYEYNGSSNGENYRTASPATASQSTEGLPLAMHALTFNGTDSYVSAPQISVASAFTVEAWIKLSGNPSGQVLVAGTASGHPQLVVRPNMSNPSGYNLVRIQFRESGGSFPGVNSVTNLSTGIWYHVAGVWDGTTIKIYVNGLLENSASIASPSANSSAFTIGGFNGSQFFPGTIDEVRLWSTARTASQIQSSYSSVPGNSSGLLGYWKFNEGSGTTAYDSTANGLNGTITNAAWEISSVLLESPAYSVSPSSLSYGNVNNNSSKLDSLTITNTGESILNITDASSSNVAFTVTPDSAAIPSGSGAKFYVMFSPTSYGNQSANISFTTNASGSPHSYSVTGIGYGPPVFSTPQNSLSFGTTALGLPAYDSIIVANNGGSDLTISSATAATSDYTLFLSSSVIAMGESTAVYVVFNPGSAGTLLDTVTIVHDGGGSPSKIALSGTGAVQSVSTPQGAITFSGNGTVATGLTNLSGSEITIEYWFKGTNVQSAVRQQGSDYIVAGWSSPPIHILSNDGGTGDGLSLGNVNDNQWHHVAMTWKQNTVNGFKSYLDGTIIAQRTSGNTPIPNMGAVTYIGSYVGVGEFTNGRMDEVRIWSVERPTDSIRYYMNRPLTGGETGLVGYWRMDDFVGTRIVDATGHGYHGTASNNGWADSDIRMPGAAMVLSSSSLSYGSIMVGATKADSVYIINTGTDPLPLSALVSTPAEMNISVADADSIIASGDSTKIYLTFTPTVSGTKNGTVTVSSGAHPDVSISWSAVATASEPTAQGTGFTYGIGIKSMTIHFTAGNGDGRIILMRSGSAVSSDPVDLTSYTANANFGSGSQVGSGNYAVYAGSGDSVVVTNLTPGTTYHIAMYEYNGTGSGINYLTTSPVTGSNSAYAPDLTKIETALSFNGNTDGTGTYIPVGGGSISFGSTMTIEAWIKWTGSSGFHIIAGRWGGGELGAGIRFAVNNGQLYANIPAGQFSYLNRSANGGSITGGVWTHVAIVYNSSVIYLYINGSQATSSGFAGGANVYNGGGYPLLIGKELASGNEAYSFPGAMDEVRIWSVARSQAQIQSGMNTPLTGSESGLLGYWQFNESSGTTAYDSVNARHSTITNSYARINSSVPFGPATTLSSVQNGEQVLSNVTLNMTDGFDSPVNLTLREHFGTSSVIPASASRMIGGKYYSISTSGTPGDFRTGMKFVLGSGAVDPQAESFPGGVQLYKRASSSETDTWEFAASADSVNVATGTVYFPDSVTSFSQFVVVEEDAALPVEIASFTVAPNRLNAELKWKTETEVNNYGFEIEKKRMGDEGGSMKWEKAGFVEGNGTTNSPKEYSFIDRNIDAGKYSYRLKQFDRSGKFEYSQSVEVEVGGAPLVFALEQNYPNPFNPSTTIGFTIQVSGLTTLKVYDAIGREVATLVNENLEAGVYHQRTFDASVLSSGIYFVRLQNSGKQLMKKMLLLK